MMMMVPNTNFAFVLQENNESFFIVMEHCGGDLFSFLEFRHFQLSEKQASKIERNPGGCTDDYTRHYKRPGESPGESPSESP